MAASFNESQKIDYLWKKVGYGVTKTAEPASKEAFNESIPSPLLYRGDLIWTQSGDIPASPPASTTSLVQVYKDGGGAGYSPTIQCTEDLTAPDNQTWKTNLINWIPTQFGDNYLVQVYAGPTGLTNPQTAGTKLFGAGSGSDDTWFFDYQSGVLNFNGATIPTAIGTGTANTIYIVGYRYVGEYGVDTTFISNGTSNVNIATANGNITMGVNGTGNVAVISNTGAYISGVVSASGNVTGNYFIGNGSQLTGVAASSVNANALIGDTLSSNVLYSSLTQVGTLSNVSVTGNVIGGNILFGSGIISGTGNITGGNVLTGGVVSATANITGGNVLTGGLISATSDITSAANITGGNLLTGGVVSATANVTGGNLLTGGLASVSGNVIGGNVLTGGLISATANVTGGNVLTGGLVSATANITGGNLLSGGLASVTGNVTGGNLLTAGLISATGNIQGGNVNTNQIRNASGNLTIGVTSGNLLLQPSGNIVLSANTYINNLAYPAQDGDAATKQYVDNLATTGISYHQPVTAATTTTLAITTGGTITYTQPNGSANGIGALLTTTGSFNLIDTANVQTVGTRILVKNEGNAVFNGVYTWANATNIVRSTDADQYGADSAEAFSINDYFYTTGGNVNAGTAFIVSAPAGTITFGTSDITFSTFSTSQVYSANTAAGISLIGTVINAKVDQDTTAFDGSGNIIVKAGANLTTPNIGAATGTSISLTGNATSGNVLTGGIVSATANITGGNVLTGGLISATSTITSAANITGGNVLTGGLISATGNVTGGGVITTGPSGNISGANVVSATTFTATANITGGNILTVGIVSTSGNVYGNAILSDNYYYANGTPVPPGIIYTAATSPPVSSKVTDQWYNTSSDVLYEYINDGTSNYWVDTTSPAFAGGVVANVAISGTLVPIANVTYDIGTSNVYFRNTYTQNLYTNNRLPAYNMPLGAVVQTVMSSSLGGSITNSTSYVDVTYATVTITPSSATSKILIIATGTSEFSSVSGFGVTSFTQLVRGASTSLQVQNTGTSGAGGVDAGIIGAISYSYMDAPATASAVTYKLQQKVSTASSTLTSTNIWLIALEIAAS